ncbi:MAG TPA: hypothetical protein VK181_23315 [Rhizobium sp.]|nr:hypothetical protein [Rhizobium sp.]
MRLFAYTFVWTFMLARFVAAGELQVKPLHWPTSSGTPLSYSVATVPFDGAEFQIGTIALEGGVWETTLPAAWIRRPGSARFPLVFAPRSNLPVSLGIACFGPEQFLSTIDDAEWARYLAGLQAEHGGSFEILEQASATIAGSKWVPVLGAKTRMVIFRHLVAPDRYETEIQLFAFLGDRLAVFVLYGPEKSVQANAGLFFGSLREFNAKWPKS